MNSTLLTTTEARNELYADLAPEIREALGKHEQVVRVPRGGSLLRYGVLPDRLVIINSGRVEISVPNSDEGVSLGTAGPGKVFGMRAVVSGETPEIDVTCLEECVVTVIPAQEFVTVLQNNPQMYFSVAKVLSGDLKIADQLIRNCARRSRPRAPERV